MACNTDVRHNGSANSASRVPLFQQAADRSHVVYARPGGQFRPIFQAGPVACRHASAVGGTCPVRVAAAGAGIRMVHAETRSPGLALAQPQAYYTTGLVRSA